jgi:hypothetical protein
MKTRACLWCGRKFEVNTGPGRPRLYCKASCKQRDYESRQRAQELGLSENELVITRDDLESMRDRRFLMACTLEDVERDLANGDTDQTSALRTLLMAAREYVGAEATASA